MSPVVTRPIKILRIITRLNIGGPAQHVVFLTERLNDGSFSTGLVAGSLGRGDGDMRPMAKRRGVPVTFMPALSNDAGVIGNVRALFDLYRLIRIVRPAIVHLHLAKARGLGGIAAKLAGVPVVIETMHGHLLRGYFGPVKARLVLAIERAIGRWMVDAVVALSDEQRQDLLSWRIAQPEKIHVVPLGLELQRFLVVPPEPGSFRRELGIGEDVFLLGTVGRLVPIKGHGILLRAVKSVAPFMRQRLMVVLVGDGPLRNQLEADARSLQIRHLVRFLGWRDDLARVYADLDVFVQPSLSEGTPVSLIEAMAAARPVIAARVGGVPDVVEDGRSGLLVPPIDSEALAGAILRLWREPELARHIAAGARRAVHPRFDVDRLVAQLGDLYVRLLTEKMALENQRRLVKDKYRAVARFKIPGLSSRGTMSRRADRP